MHTFLHFGRDIRPLFVVTMLLSAIALLATSVLAVIRHLTPICPADSNLAGQLPPKYSFVGDDYPMYYPLDIRDVFLVPEDTVHYGIIGTDADKEWESVFPPGEGFVLLGPNRRPFGLALYHQMHCLDRIRHGIGKTEYHPHIHHCINYLRQAVLCEADTTLEVGVPSLGRKVVRSSMEKTCKDWTQVYEAAKEEYEAGSKR